MSERKKEKRWERKRRRDEKKERKKERGREGERKKNNKTCSKITGRKGKVGRTNVQFEETVLYKSVPSWPKPLLYASCTSCITSMCV